MKGEILSMEEYRTIAAGDTATLNYRTNLIYETRKRFIDSDPNRWLALHQAYQPLWNELIQYKKIRLLS